MKLIGNLYTLRKQDESIEKIMLMWNPQAQGRRGKRTGNMEKNSWEKGCCRRHGRGQETGAAREETSRGKLYKQFVIQFVVECKFALTVTFYMILLIL